MTSKLNLPRSRSDFPVRARLTAVPALAAIGLLAACSAQGGSATPRVTVAVTAHPGHAATAGASGQAAAPATRVAAPASAPAAPPPPAPCSTRYLGAKVGLSQGATGSTYVMLVFKNLNDYPCTLYGYPGVALDAGVPVTQVGLAAAEDPATPRKLVTLGAHGTASALLRIVHPADYSPAACRPVTTRWLQIIPPNQYVPIYLGYTSQTCAKPVQILTVDAVRPGAGGS